MSSTRQLGSTGSPADDVIARARAGDEAALRLLYETHRPRILRLAYGLLGDADEAEDVMQDVMIYALRNLDRYQPERAAFGTWVYTIAVSRCRDCARRRRLRGEGLRERLQAAVAEPAAPADDLLDRIDAAAAVGPALAKLTPIQREALLLRVVEDLSFAEIGQALGIPLRTAQTRVNSAVAALRQQLAGDRAGAVVREVSDAPAH